MALLKPRLNDFITFFKTYTESIELQYWYKFRESAIAWSELGVIALILDLISIRLVDAHLPR